MKGYLSMLLSSILVFANSLQAQPDALVKAAQARTLLDIRYDGSYHKLAYPGGDVPDNIGVCTDLVIRSYRTLGVDLQQLVHEDIRQHFSLYPSKRIWGLSKPDRNIDHRRVPNLQVFLGRYGQSLPLTQQTEAFLAGDIVTWMLPGNLPHIGIVSDKSAPDGTPLVLHNIGAGPVEDNSLLRYPIPGHYRYPAATEQ
ncbi:DUF1287 domain-containing protein [Bowmanella yangjiangensis]|uniref:DUF1287 domain-containing protein n=1 Tax=Bowmanella yangjiangensis TaxID=2811230 RepID=UPI001E36DDF2|nr:DUF1287 domain-containing protein [Bowmanella yangjiangensis]